MRNNLCSFQILTLLLTFNWKKLFHVYIFIVFFFKIVMLENPAPFSMNFSSPHEIFLHGKILPRSPLPSTLHPNQKNPPEKFGTLPNNHYCM